MPKFRSNIISCIAILRNFLRFEEDKKLALRNWTNQQTVELNFRSHGLVGEGAQGAKWNSNTNGQPAARVEFHVRHHSAETSEWRCIHSSAITRLVFLYLMMKYFDIQDSYGAKPISPMSIMQLRGALQCSLPHLIDFEYPGESLTWKIACTQKKHQYLLANLIECIDYYSIGRYLPGESPIYGTRAIEVVLNDDETITIQWELPSTKCQEFMTGVWLRIYEPSSATNKSNSTPFNRIPSSCLKKHGNGFSFTFPSTESQDTCRFPFSVAECRDHAVELIPNYFNLRGKVIVARFNSSPKVNFHI